MNMCITDIRPDYRRSGNNTLRDIDRMETELRHKQKQNLREAEELGKKLDHAADNLERLGEEINKMKRMLRFFR